IRYKNRKYFDSHNVYDKHNAAASKVDVNQSNKINSQRSNLDTEDAESKKQIEYDLAYQKLKEETAHKKIYIENETKSDEYSSAEYYKHEKIDLETRRASDLEPKGFWSGENDKKIKKSNKAQTKTVHDTKQAVLQEKDHSIIDKLDQKYFKHKDNNFNDFQIRFTIRDNDFVKLKNEELTQSKEADKDREEVTKDTKKQLRNPEEIEHQTKPEDGKTEGRHHYRNQSPKKISIEYTDISLYDGLSEKNDKYIPEEENKSNYKPKSRDVDKDNKFKNSQQDAKYSRENIQDRSQINHKKEHLGSQKYPDIVNRRLENSDSHTPKYNRLPSKAMPRRIKSFSVERFDKAHKQTLDQYVEQEMNDYHNPEVLPPQVPHRKLKPIHKPSKIISRANERLDPIRKPREDGVELIKVNKPGESEEDGQGFNKPVVQIETTTLKQIYRSDSEHLDKRPIDEFINIEKNIQNNKVEEHVTKSRYEQYLQHFHDNNDANNQNHLKNDKYAENPMSNLNENGEKPEKYGERRPTQVYESRPHSQNQPEDRYNPSLKPVTPNYQNEMDTRGVGKDYDRQRAIDTNYGNYPENYKTPSINNESPQRSFPGSPEGVNQEPYLGAAQNDPIKKESLRFGPKIRIEEKPGYRIEYFDFRRRHRKKNNISGAKRKLDSRRNIELNIMRKDYSNNTKSKISKDLIRQWRNDGNVENEQKPSGLKRRRRTSKKTDFSVIGPREIAYLKEKYNTLSRAEQSDSKISINTVETSEQDNHGDNSIPKKDNDIATKNDEKMILSNFRRRKEKHGTKKYEKKKTLEKPVVTENVEKDDVLNLTDALIDNKVKENNETTMTDDLEEMEDMEEKNYRENFKSNVPPIDYLRQVTLDLGGECAALGSERHMIRRAPPTLAQQHAATVRALIKRFNQ
ncbi:uncharacterized protein LOC113225518, partial [Hyposmocoma kahamanoa]|uniref:uncharacterized protein LOC113225518 n=1 Tax=Hyposmocoma kahamanoa TaxID=1477025 RepID=UPI000E6D6C2F